MSRQIKLVLVISILASFVAFLDGSVVNVALPSIIRDLGGGLQTQQWVVDAYLVTLGSLILIAGSLSDVFGRRQVLAAGLIGFGVASALCAVAPSSSFLIVARLLQGAAGAFVVPSSLALIIAYCSGEAQAKAIGTWTAWTGIAFVIGPLLGGFLVDSTSWRLVFAINILPIAITLWLMTLLEKPQADTKRAPVDVTGALLCTFGLGGPVYALIEQPHYGWASPLIWIPLLAGLMLLAAFLWYEHRRQDPMLPLGLFAVRNFSVGNIATVAIYAGLSVATFLLAIFLQQIGHYSALRAGLATLPISIIMFFLAPRFGALAGKFGPRFFMAIGPLVGACGFLLMTRIQADAIYVSQVLPAVLVFGFGLSMTVAPLTAAVLGSIESEHAGIGSAVNNAIARIAGLLAIAAVGVVIGSRLDVTSFHKGNMFTAGLLIVGGLISAIGIQNVTTTSMKINREQTK